MEMNMSDHEGFGSISVTTNKYFRTSVFQQLKKIILLYS